MRSFFFVFLLTALLLLCTRFLNRCPTQLLLQQLVMATTNSNQELDQHIDKIAQAIANLQPIPKNEQTKDLHVAMVDMFEALELKSDVESKILQKVKQRSQTISEIQPIMPTELPENLPRVRGPASYYQLTLKPDNSIRHVVITTSGPYVIIGDPMPPSTKSQSASKACPKPALDPLQDQAKTTVTAPMAPGQQPAPLTNTVTGQQGPVNVNMNANTAATTSSISQQVPVPAQDFKPVTAGTTTFSNTTTTTTAVDKK